MLLQKETPEFFSTVMSSKSIVSNSSEEDFIDNYQKIYDFVDTEEVSLK